MIKEFRDFVLRGNVVDLAVAVVIGAAFTALVTALVKDLLTPLIAAVAGNPDFSNLKFTLNDSVFRYGDFLNAAVAFLLIAAVVFFLVVKPLNALMARLTPGQPVDRPTRACPECESDIPTAARRCAFAPPPSNRRQGPCRHKRSRGPRSPGIGLHASAAAASLHP